MVAAAAAEDHRDYASLDTDAGTLTIVFSDIESSTERAVELGDAKWVELLGVHNTIVRRARRVAIAAPRSRRRATASCSRSRPPGRRCSA